MSVTESTSRVTRSLRNSLPRTPASGPRTTSTSMPSSRNGCGSYWSFVATSCWIGHTEHVEDAQPLDEGKPREAVSRKERQLDLLLAVLPLAPRVAQREERVD